LLTIVISISGDFLGGVKTYADTINTFDVLVIEQGSEAFLLLDDSTKRAVYISNITGELFSIPFPAFLLIFLPHSFLYSDNTNGTLQYSCFVCNFTTVQPGFSAEYRGLVADSNQSIVGVLLFTQSLVWYHTAYICEWVTHFLQNTLQSDLAITQNSLLLFTLNGSFIGEVYRQPNNSFTDTTTLCLSSNLQMVVVMQPVILEPGYVSSLATSFFEANNNPHHIGCRVVLSHLRRSFCRPGCRRIQREARSNISAVLPVRPMSRLPHPIIDRFLVDEQFPHDRIGGGIGFFLLSLVLHLAVASINHRFFEVARYVIFIYFLFSFFFPSFDLHVGKRVQEGEESTRERKWSN